MTGKSFIPLTVNKTVFEKLKVKNPIQTSKGGMNAITLNSWIDIFSVFTCMS